MVLRSYSAHRFRMASLGGDVSTSAAGKGKKSVQPREGVGLADTQKSIEQLNAREFKERFHVPDSQSYVVPSLPCFAPRVLVPGEHYVVKDLPFYEEARAADTKARQDQLAKRAKKRKEGTLRQALGGSHLASNSTTHPSSKKKSITGLLRRP
ncbi:hypothetical protein VitviT2T_017021 [Vitis vinifera]|uniref:Uncharacterized protein n=1 Tax=Vitis vinifera TaxID=29760 RepID=A0ABY9CTS9_VITVI|nr:hypothetical protein VitviT2T_017021 [Vitis vinifera]